jgi:hypothetical protein
MSHDNHLTGPDTSASHGMQSKWTWNSKLVSYLSMVVNFMCNHIINYFLRF